MRGIITRFGARTGLALLVLAPTAPARGETVPFHMVPTPVLDAVRARFRGAKIAGAERERESHGLVYEVTIRHQGQPIDITLTPEGTILLIKREIAATSLPPPVTKALETAYPKATYQVVEAVSRVQGPDEQLAYFEVDLVTVQRRIVEVRVSADGRILTGKK